jgi:hypothetical protein
VGSVLGTNSTCVGIYSYSQVSKFGPSNGHIIYQIDGQPGSWSYTHHDVRPSRLTYDEQWAYIQSHAVDILQVSAKQLPSLTVIRQIPLLSSLHQLRCRGRIISARILMWLWGVLLHHLTGQLMVARNLTLGSCNRQKTMRRHKERGYCTTLTYNTSTI